MTAGENLKSSLKRRAKNLCEIFITKAPKKKKVTKRTISIKKTTKKKGSRDKLTRQWDMFSLKIMMAVLDPKKDHIECSILDTDLFTVPFVQSDIKSGTYEDINPIINLEDNGPIAFVIYRASDIFFLIYFIYS